MRSRELILLEFSQLLNLFCSFGDSSPCDHKSVVKAFDSLVTDAELIGLPRHELREFVFSKWLNSRQSEVKARSVAESVSLKLRGMPA